MKKGIFLLLFFYILTLIQTSFFVHLPLLRRVPFIFIAVILSCLFVSQRSWWGVVAAFIGGFYLDVFSISDRGFFGFYVLIALVISLFIKFILKKHIHLAIRPNG